MSGENEAIVESPEATVDPFDLSDEQLDAYDVTMVPESTEDSSDDTDEDDDSTELDSTDQSEMEDDDELDVDETEEAEQDETDETEESEPEETSEIDYKAEHEKLLAPFRANGKEIQVDSVEEATKLMQMGANYTKKMVELKPHLKMIKMLQKNELMDEGKLNYLIDLSKKDPSAIAKLVKDSGIDPLDIDQESTEYTPKNYTVSDKEVNLDEVLGRLESTPTYEKTLDIVGNKWDDSSKEILSGKPQLIVEINNHVANGIYDKITTEIDKQQMFNGLQGLSNLEAYQKVGKELYDKGAFNEPKAPVTSRSKPKVKQSEAVRNLKKRAASPTKTAPKKAVVKKDINYFDLSEEEFNNLPNKY